MPKGQRRCLWGDRALLLGSLQADWGWRKAQIQLVRISVRHSLGTGVAFRKGMWQKALAYPAWLAIFGLTYQHVFGGRVLYVVVAVGASLGSFLGHMANWITTYSRSKARHGLPGIG